ncbi:MAG: adenylyl-sulfate kinase [Bacteroidales bacterium]|nr:MAG: adenylyl-sulfate kinase [Bacteroidales bacterium]
MVIWITGLSASGKTTLGTNVDRELKKLGYRSRLIDGDEIRKGLCRDLGFSEADRKENIRRIAEVAKMFMNSELIPVCCFISPTRSIRELAKEIIGAEHFVEVFMDAPLEICENRDPKNLYKKARKGEIPDFTGIDAPYEAPENPDIVIHSDRLSVEESVKKVLEIIIPKLKS